MLLLSPPVLAVGRQADTAAGATSLARAGASPVGLADGVHTDGVGVGGGSTETAECSGQSLRLHERLPERHRL